MADYPSNLKNAGQTTPSVAPGTIRPVYGSVVIAANSTVNINDTLSLFTMPGPSSHIITGWLDIPIIDSGNTVRFKLFDGTNNIITAITANVASRVVVEVSAVAALLGSAVTYAGATALGPITLTCTTGAGASVGAAAVTLYFAFGIAMD